MPRFPKYGFPYQYYSHYNYMPHAPVSRPIPTPEETKPTKSPTFRDTKHEEPVWMNLFGIKLYFDDILILSLLFFLYKEEVKDEGLFLALVLLLIS